MIVVDNFAGGGGASLGIEQSLGRPVDIAVNHDPQAVAMHRANHPHTEHLTQDVWDVDPEDLRRRGPILLVWFSPDCTHHSKAKGGVPIRSDQKKTRDLAWVVVRYARVAAPSIIMLENVEEFADWCPLVDGLPDRTRTGETFRQWVAALQDCGYRVEWRELHACDYGAPTIRKRLFVIARRDGLPITWPAPTHGPGLAPYRTAADCISWHRPVHSIFLTPEEGRSRGVRRPLAEKTMARIARGTQRYVLDAHNPFIAPAAAGTMGVRNNIELIAPWMAQHNSGMTGHSCLEPVSTIVGRGSTQGLVACHLTRQFGASVGQPLNRPAPTVMPGGGGKTALVASFLSHFHVSNTVGGDGDLRKPMNTVLAGGCHKALVQAFLRKYTPASGRVTIEAVDYHLVDIGMRMLVPRELFRAQGFPDSYRIEIQHGGKNLSKAAQIRMCGNSVSPPIARALVTANVSADPAVVRDSRAPFRKAA